MMHRDSVNSSSIPPVPSSPRRATAPARRWAVLLACSFLGPVTFASVPAVANTNGIVAVPDLAGFKSGFRPKLGKDPFFPKSRRLETGKALAPLPPVLPLVLKGISGAKGRRLAIINNRTFEVGEQAEFKFNNQTIRVRCIEIREHSAVISIDGMAPTQELQLNQRL